MSAAMFKLARTLKFDRFTLDVLMQRLAALRHARQHPPDESARFVGQTGETIAACDQLHNELHDDFYNGQAVDTGVLLSLNGRLEELHRKIGESLARLNSFEYGGAYRR